jgi:hypothetical protein
MKAKLTKIIASAAFIGCLAKQVLAEEQIINSANQTNELSPFEITVSPEIFKIHIKEIFKVRLEVKNISNTNQHFTIMSCSWWEHWVSDNRQIGMWPGYACAQNKPVKVELAPGESWKKDLKMWVPEPVTINKISFKMSFEPLPFDPVTPHVQNGKEIWQIKKKAETYRSTVINIAIYQ